MAGIKVVRSNRVMALSPVARAIRGRYSWGTDIPSTDDTNSPPVASTTLSLGDIEVGTGSEITSVDILTGVVDADGDTLSVSSVTLATGSATITGNDPWTITPTDEGAGSATAVISDGQGGSVNRTVTWNAITQNVVTAFTLLPTNTGILDSASPFGDDNPDLTVSGSSVHGNTITLSSASSIFTDGALPERLIYNDYSNGVIGQTPETSALVGSWDTAGGFHGQTTFVEGGFNGRPALPIYDHSQDPDNGTIGTSTPLNRRGLIHEDGFDEAFFATAIKVPAGKSWFGNPNDSAWGGTTPAHGIFPGDSCLKLAWYGIDENDDIADLITFAYGSQQGAIGGNNGPAGISSAGLQMNLPAIWDWNGWNHYKSWFKRDRTTPSNSDVGHQMFSSVGNSVKTAKNEVHKTGGLYNSVNYCRWARGNPNAMVLSGYEYQAVGAYSQCRLEIGRHPVYSKSKAVPCPPSAWSASGISALVNTSDLDETKPLYVFAINRDGSPYSYGKLINPEVVNNGL